MQELEDEGLITRLYPGGPDGPVNQGDTIVATKRRKIWQVFRDIDKKKYTLEATEFAKPIIGVNKWSDLIPNFRWRSME